jgi:hypothetical protein
VVGRKVRAFASAIDVDQNVVFESFSFEPRAPSADDNGHGVSLDQAPG